MKATFIYSQKFGQFPVPDGHPWNVARSDVCYRLCLRFGLMNHNGITLREPGLANRQELSRFHAPKYLDFLTMANDGYFHEDMLHSGLGTAECPIFKGVYEYGALMAGAGRQGAELVLRGEADVVFSPSGGMHHAGPDFAAGFCYLNDLVIAINRLLDAGLKVFYVDIDAHHGDQVQAAYYGDDRVLFLSFHEDPRTLFPFHTGFETELGEGRGRGFNVNVPLLAGTSDQVFMWAFHQVFPPLISRFEPDVVVGVFGMDTVFSDPLTHLQLTNNGVAEAVGLIASLAPRLLAFGSGGYVLDNVARGWTRVWGIITGQEPLEDVGLTLGGVFIGNDDVSLRDAAHYVPDKTFAAARAEAERVVSYLKKEVLL